MKITATDPDEAENPNSEIAYTIMDQNPPNDMFYITSDGTIHVKKPFLDREVRAIPKEGQCFLYLILTF